MTGTDSDGLDELSRTLRKLRGIARQPGKLPLHQVAERTGFSISKINRIERGKTVPAPEDAEALARAYGATPETQRHVRALAETVKAGSRRIVLSRRANREGFQRRLLNIEKASEQIREFSPMVIPGLLQTAEYMWAIWATGGGDHVAGAAFVANRLARQVAIEEPGRRVTILTTEGALGWSAGPATMMIRQLDHIAAAIGRSTVRVGVIPFGVPASVFPISNWTLYDERACVPGVLATQVILNDADVAPYVEQYELLEPLAVFDAEARAILAKTAARYRELGDKPTT